MELVNCARCGKVFARVGKNICPDCLAEEEETFKKVREFIEENPGLTVHEVAEKCAVAPKKIYGFLKEGRLQRQKFNASETKWRCESCGAYITSGRLCQNCQKILKDEMLAHENEKLKPDARKKTIEKGKIHLSRLQDR